MESVVTRVALLAQRHDIRENAFSPAAGHIPYFRERLASKLQREIYTHEREICWCFRSHIDSSGEMQLDPAYIYSKPTAQGGIKLLSATELPKLFRARQQVHAHEGVERREKVVGFLHLYSTEMILAAERCRLACAG